MRTTTTKQTGCIRSIERLNSSAMGNPRFSLKVSLWSDDGTSERTTIETSPNSMIAYAIDQSMLCRTGGGAFEFTYHTTEKRGTKILDGFESMNERHEKERAETKRRMEEIDRQMTERREQLFNRATTKYAARQLARTTATTAIDFQSNRFAWESSRHTATLSMLEAKLAGIRAALRGDKS